MTVQKSMVSPLFLPGLCSALCLGLCLALAAPAAHSAPYDDAKNAYLSGDYAKALQVLQPLAGKGNGEAMVLLSLMYDNGQGVPKNEAQAVEWLRKAAELGIPDAQHDLGLRYYQGKGVTQNHLEAGKWWEPAAKAGVPDSQFNLGLMYYRGLGVTQDYARAQGLFRSATDQGHDHAQYSLGVMHAFGQGVEKNYVRAQELFQKSANQGVAQAQYNLGVFYENGYGVNKDLGEARRWYRLAAAQKLQEAQNRLNQIDSQIGDKTSTQPSISALSTPIAPLSSSVTPPVTPPPARGITSSPSDVVERADWVRQQPPNAYTLQVVSTRTETDILNFISKYPWNGQIAYVKVRIKGELRYNALYGNYPHQAMAKQAIASLPAAIQKNKPWPRSFGALLPLLAE